MARTLVRLKQRRGIYPWAKWTNGRTWRAERGKDFNCLAENFRSVLHQLARRRGLVVETSSGVDGEFVDFRFSDPRKRKSKKRRTS